MGDPARDRLESVYQSAIRIVNDATLLQAIIISPSELVFDTQVPVLVSVLARVIFHLRQLAYGQNSNEFDLAHRANPSVFTLGGLSYMSCLEAAWSVGTRHYAAFFYAIKGRMITPGDPIEDFTSDQILIAKHEICAAYKQFDKPDAVAVTLHLQKEFARACEILESSRPPQHAIPTRFPADALWRELDDAAVRIEHGRTLGGPVEFLRGSVPSTAEHLNCDVLNRLADEARLRPEGPLVEFDGTTTTFHRPYGAPPLVWSKDGAPPSMPILVATGLRDWRDLRAEQLRGGARAMSPLAIEQGAAAAVIVDRASRTVKRGKDVAEFGKKEEL